jgi:hypothetical protein
MMHLITVCRNAFVICVFRCIEWEILPLLSNTNEKAVCEKTITRDFHAIHKRNELKMHVSEMMPKMKEPRENVKVRKIG